MDSLRVFAALVLAISCFLLFEAWMGKGEERVSQEIIELNETTSENSDLPEVTENLKLPVEPAITEDVTGHDSGESVDQYQSFQVLVETDTLLVSIDTRGPEIQKVELREHPAKHDPELNFILLQKVLGHTYVAQHGLIGEGLPNHKDVFTSDKEEYKLLPNQDKLVVEFKKTGDASEVIHRYIFAKGSYVIDLETEIVNLGGRPINGHSYYQLVRDDSNPDGSSMMMPTYTGVAIYTDESKYEKVDFSDIRKGERKYPTSADNGWISVIQHYFLGAWLPQDGIPREYFTRVLREGLFAVGVILPVTDVPVSGRKVIKNKLYVGPQDQDKLAVLSQGLNLTVDYGWLTVIASPLFHFLKWINGYVNNWGWAIIVLTIVIKLLFYPLSAASYKSMAKMRVVAPKLQKLKELYGNDKQRMQQEMMAMYKKEKINPLGGCLPILVQIPVFIALYWVLLASVELRYAPFIFWIDDLSAKDPFYILPILMGASMIIQTRLNPTPPDPVQAKIMKIMPIVFSVFFFFFPSGLVLYWLANNVLSIAQQWRITTVIENQNSS